MHAFLLSSHPPAGRAVGSSLLSRTLLSFVIPGWLATTVMFALFLAGNLQASAGTVHVSIEEGRWRLQGDPNHNAITITQLPNGNVRVAGAPSDGGVTTITGAQTFFPNLPVSIGLGGGGDRVSINGSASVPVRFASSLEVSMGAGVDIITGSYVTVVGSLSLDLGAQSTGPNYLERAELSGIDAGPVSFRCLAPNPSSFSLGGSSIVRGDLTVEGSAHSNTIAITSTAVAGWVVGNLGNEENSSAFHDVFQLSGCNVAGRVRLDMGNGRSAASFSNSTARRVRVETLGYNADVVSVHNCHFNRLFVDLGAGSQDRVTGYNNTFLQEPELIGVEIDQLD